LGIRSARLARANCSAGNFLGGIRALILGECRKTANSTAAEAAVWHNRVMSFAGMRVLALESRRSSEMTELIRKQGGDPFGAPSMREVPIEENADAFQFAERLFAAEFDMVMLLTGVGTRQLKRLLGTRHPETAFADALRRVTVAARGPKPVAALREMGLKPTLVAPEPNTWRELLQVTEGRPERRIAVQEYGRSNPEFLNALRVRGGEATPVRVYQYGLPEDTGPLREAARRLAAGDFQVALFTTAVQIEHLLRVAEEEGIGTDTLDGLRQTWIGSIGPSTTEALEEFGLHPHFEPSHPKMGILVKEAAEICGATQ
jgi:uroporphyrinogen-III synthase